MSYRIGTVKMRNFGPFAKAEFDFDQPGLTVVEGVMVGVPGCSSNGSGKSFILEAPVWALTGRLIRPKVSVDDVVHGYGESCEVSAEIVGGERKIVITRYRKHPDYGSNVYLEIDGKDVSRGTNVETDRAIEAELGLDFTTLMNTIAFGARSDARSFFMASDSDRKAIMQRLLGLEIYAHAQKLAKVKAREIADEVEGLMTAELDLATRIMEQNTFLGKVEVAEGAEDRELEALEASALVRVLRGVHFRQDLRFKQAVADRDAEAERYRDQLSKYRQVLDNIDRARSRIEKAQREASRVAGAADSELVRIARSIESIRELVGAMCPTCHQELTPSGAEKAVTALEGASESAAEAVNEIETKLTALKTELEKIAEAPEEPSRWAVETVEEELGRERGRRTRLEGRLDTAIERAALLAREQDRQTNTVSEIQAKIEELRTEQDGLVEKRTGLQERAARLDFWVTGFGNSGLQSYLIEAELSEINKAATGFAARLLGSGAQVCLLPTKQLKTKAVTREEMVVEATIPNCAQNYAGSSKGQRHRLDLSLILALRDVVERRSMAAFDQLFCDELFDGVDDAGTDCVIEIIRELADERPVILVTHDPRLKSIGDRTVTVRHENGVATL